MDASSPRRSRACRACENCRKRKVKCSGGDVCSECRRFKVECVYRQHYRSKRGFSIKILQSPEVSGSGRAAASGSITTTPNAASRVTTANATQVNVAPTVTPNGPILATTFAPYQPQPQPQSQSQPQPQPQPQSQPQQLTYPYYESGSVFQPLRQPQVTPPTQFQGQFPNLGQQGYFPGSAQPNQGPGLMINSINQTFSRPPGPVYQYSSDVLATDPNDSANDSATDVAIDTVNNLNGSTTTPSTDLANFAKESTTFAAAEPSPANGSYSANDPPSYTTGYTNYNTFSSYPPASTPKPTLTMPLKPARPSFAHRLLTFVHSRLSDHDRNAMQDTVDQIELSLAEAEAELRLSESKVPAGLAIASDLHLTEEQMLQVLNDFFEAYQFLNPILHAETWIRKAKTAWRTLEFSSVYSFGPSSTSTPPPAIDDIDLAIIFVLLAVGCSGRVSVKFAGTEDRVWAFEYFRRAKALAVPTLALEQASVRSAQFLLISSWYHVSRGEPMMAYLTTGAAVRCGQALGCDKLTPQVVENCLKSTPSLQSYQSYANPIYEKHRLWVVLWIWEQYWSFCVRRPPVTTRTAAVEPFQPAFNLETDFPTSWTHILLKIKVMRALGMTLTGELNFSDLVHSYKITRGLLDECTNVLKYVANYKNAPYLLRDDALEDLRLVSVADVREWYWLRLYRWYIRIVMFRPFLVAATYVGLGRRDTSHLAPEIISALTEGSAICLEASQRLPHIIDVLEKRIERTSVNWASRMMVEFAVAVMLVSGSNPTSVESLQLSSSIITSPTLPSMGLLAHSLLESPQFWALLDANTSDFVDHFFSGRLLESLPGEESIIVPKFEGPITQEDIKICWDRAIVLIGIEG